MRRLLLAFFERLYGPWSAAYEPIAWLVSRGAWADWVRAAQPFVAAPVLEIGPGTGHLLVALAAAGLAVTGLDRSAPLLTRAGRRLRAAGLAQRAVLRQGDARALPFADGAFRTVVTTFPAPFVLDPSVPAEIRRVLSDDGSWVVVDGVVPGGRDVTSRLVRGLLARPSGARGGTAPATFMAGLVAAGFAVTSQVVLVGRDEVTVLVARPVGPGRTGAAPG